MPEVPPWMKRISPLAVWRRHRAIRAGRRANSIRVKRPRTYQPIHLATLIVLSGFALAVTGIAAGLMWDAAQVPAGLPNSPDLAVRTAQLRVDVIRNILAVGAGTGGLIALFLALRRQYVKERVDYDDQAHKTRTADETKHDAAERRVTELYAKAAEQLGSDKAAVRLAALYSLERVGQDNPEHRQTITSLICAYLRMPFIAPIPVGTAGSGETHTYLAQLSHQEDEVRLTAQRILTSHLRYWEIKRKGRDRTPVGPDTFWPGMELNLNGAILGELSLHKCAVSRLHLVGASIRSTADFREMFSPDAVDMSSATFGAMVHFGGAQITSVLLCVDTIFEDALDFSRTYVTLADFKGAKFRGTADFSDLVTMGVFLKNAWASLVAPREHSWPKEYILVKEDEIEGMGPLKWIAPGPEINYPD